MTQYRAGAATVCITPDEPLWLAGYAARTAPACGKLSDLYANALALEDESGQRFVIVSVDVIAITRAVAHRVAEAVRSRHGLPRRQLLLAATHTHYAPEFRADKQVFFNVPPEYAARFPAFADKLIAAMTQVAGDALARVEPVRLFARQAAASFGHNRRRHGVKDGKPSPADVVDHEVPVLDCVDVDGRRKAIVFGYACHNTTIPLEDVRYCGDWAGFAKERLQQANPGATALFIAGAGADQDPEPRGSVALSQQYGQDLASAVQGSLERRGVEITGPMRVEMDDMVLPLQQLTRDRLQRMLDSDDPPKRVKARYHLGQLDRGEALMTSYSVALQVVRFGNELVIVALGGEPVVDWAHKLKRGAWSVEQGAESSTPNSMNYAAASPLVWVAGYCNDMCGYIPTRRLQAEGGYEGGRANLWDSIPAPFTDDVEDRVTDAVRRLVERVSN